MKTTIVFAALAVSGLLAIPTNHAASTAATEKAVCKCGQPKCQCDNCNERCRCCGPKIEQCPGPNCPLRPPLVEGQRFYPSRTPVDQSGVRAWVDLPSMLHKKNTGGIGPFGPGTGAGLCVYTSVWHTAMWQNVPSLYGFRDWMKNKQGGSWPEKFDSTLKAYCREKGYEVPDYIQHTGGDVDFLKQCLKTGRLVSVTYSGRDDFYRGQIAHMVNVVHLDNGRACILDNNRPNVFLWMSEQDFVERWLEMGGGWAIVLLAPPPPTHAVTPKEAFDAAPLNLLSPPPAAQTPQFPYEGEYEVEAKPLTYSRGAALAKERNLPLVTFVGRTAYKIHGCLVAHEVSLDGFAPNCVVVSKWIDGRHVGIQATRVSPLSGLPDIDSALAILDPRNKSVIDNYGVDFSRIAREKRYSRCGSQCNRRQAFDALASLDDSANKWNLAFVKSEQFQNSNRNTKVHQYINRLPDAVKDRLNIQVYEPTDWHVKHFNLKVGINVREPDGPQIDRVSKDAGYLSLSDAELEAILKILDDLMNPKPPPLPSIPAPTPPEPEPVIPEVPDDALTPLLSSAGCCTVCVLLLMYLYMRTR